MQAEKLTLRQGQRDLVAKLDWQVLPGECWCVIGRNGVGKSSLLRALAGLREVDGGNVRFDGRALRHWPLLELARRRAYLPQERHDSFGYRAIDIALAARHPHCATGYWDADEDYRAALRALQALDVHDLAKRDVRTLSGGERQRVAIASVLAQDAPLLLLDEPASALDLAHQVSVMNLLAQLIDAGKSVVLVSHDLNLAHRVATHALLLMSDGGWHAATTAEAMRTDSLSTCLGYPVEVVRHKGRVVFVPAQERRRD